MTAEATFKDLRGRRRRLGFFAVGLATAIVGVVLFSAAPLSGVTGSKPERPAIFDEPRELSREWRWVRKPYTFDHMFMEQDQRERRRRQGCC